MRALLIIFSMFFVLGACAQDKIIKQSNDTIDCRVTEINLSEVRYKKESNLDGPTYVISKSSVKSIMYSNGEVDKFEELNASGSDVNIYKSPSSFRASNEEIFIKNYNYYYKGKRLSKRKLQSLIVATGDQMIIEEYDRSKTLQTTAYITGFASIPAFWVGTLVTLSSFSLNMTGFWVGFATGHGLLISNHALRKIYKNKRNHAVEMYNDHIKQDSHNGDYY